MIFPPNRILYFITLLLISLAFSSCGGMRVTYDYDTATDFSNYATYNYRENMAMGLSELDEGRIKHAMDSVLYGLGLQYSEEPDLYINIYSQAYTEPGRTNVGVGVGGTGRNVGGGVSIGVPVGRESIYREFFIDFVDSGGQDLVWQALVATKYNPMADVEEREEFFRELVRKALEGYPPE